MNKRKFFSTIFIFIFCSVALFLHFSTETKIKDFNSKNTSLKTELGTLKKEQASLNNENSKLKENNLNIEKKINSLKDN